MKPGDVLLLWFPFSHREAEPYKKRPVLLLGPSATGHGAEEALLVAMITSNERRVARPKAADLVVPNHQIAGLPLPSVVRTNRLWTAETADVEKILGRVGDDFLKAVRGKVRQLLS